MFVVFIGDGHTALVQKSAGLSSCYTVSDRGHKKITREKER